MSATTEHLMLECIIAAAIGLGLAIAWGLTFDNNVMIAAMIVAVWTTQLCIRILAEQHRQDRPITRDFHIDTDEGDD